MKKILFTLLIALLVGCSNTSKMPSGHSGHHGESSRSRTPRLGGGPSQEEGENFFSTATEGLPEVKPSEMISNIPGETIELSIGAVKQLINGQWVRRLAYNGKIPGPLIRVKPGDTATIKVTNNSEVETTLHSHGVRLDNAFDGTPGVTQAPIKPGESFTYQVKFPDQGVFWYHPHIREDYTQEAGLYGNYISVFEDYFGPADKESVLVLDDLLLGKEGLEPFTKEETNYALMGRFGNVLLVNNQENYTESFTEGQLVRFYLTNVANTRTFSVSIPGAKMKWRGSDNGHLEKDVWVDHLVLAPSERAVVDVLFEKAGTYNLEHKTPEKTSVMAQFTVQEGELEKSYQSEFETLGAYPEDYALVRAKMDEYLKKEPDKKLRLTIDLSDSPHAMHSMGGAPIEWEDSMPMMNQMSLASQTAWQIQDDVTGKSNHEIKDWEFKKGDLVKIRVVNDPASAHPMQHPFHMHGQRFVILSRQGVPEENLAWKDTVLIPAGETIDLLVEMSNPGEWMAHCHIAEHLHAGMMFGFRVKE